MIRGITLQTRKRRRNAGRPGNLVLFEIGVGGREERAYVRRGGKKKAVGEKRGWGNARALCVSKQASKPRGTFFLRTRSLRPSRPKQTSIHRLICSLPALPRRDYAGQLVHSLSRLRNTRAHLPQVVYTLVGVLDGSNRIGPLTYTILTQPPSQPASPAMASSIHLTPAAARGWTHEGSRASSEAAVLAFHETLPGYGQTPLRPLPAVARALGLGHVLVKDESDRFGLPAFKVLGASWAVYRAVGWHLGLPVADGQIPIAELGARARRAGLEIVTATEGNCGRAVARIARLMGIPARVWVPAFMPEATRALIRAEAAEVVVVDGSYDDLIPILWEEADDRDTVLVLDVGFKGYTDIPKVGDESITP